MNNTKKTIYEISVVVVTYNATWESLTETLDSIIMQEDVLFEIIIADDGSADNHQDKIKEYFILNGITNFKMVLNPTNKGTVYNLISGIELAEGEYIKDISPGDLLYKKDTLKKWIAFMKKEDLIWSFSESIYYKNNGKNKEIFSCYANPNDISPYIEKNIEKCRWNYLVLDDIALGAAMIARTNVQYKYLKKIENIVKYAEDNIWRLMMFDGVKFGYYQNITMWYEYGEGVSTVKSDVWQKRLKNDWDATNDIFLSRNVKDMDSFQKKVVSAYKYKKNKFANIFIRGMIMAKLQRKFCVRNTINSLPKETSYEKSTIN